MHANHDFQLYFFDQGRKAASLLNYDSWVLRRGEASNSDEIYPGKPGGPCFKKVGAAMNVTNNTSIFNLVFFNYKGDRMKIYDQQQER